MTTTYTPERQMFPPGTKVKAVCNRTGTTSIGVVLGPTDRIWENTHVGATVSTGYPFERLYCNWSDLDIDRETNYGKAYNCHTFTKLEDPKKELQPMQSIKSAAESIRRHVKPYEKYLVAAAVLLALDHFVLKGAMTNRIQRLAQSLADRLAGMVDGLIARIGGE